VHTRAPGGAWTRAPPGATTGASGPARDDRVTNTMIPTDHDCPSASASRRDAVAIVTGGSFGTGRDVARVLAGWGWAIVLVYLEHQPTAEATVAEILAAQGSIVAVRADLADDLDVQRLFAESAAAFGGVDVVVHTTTGTASPLYEHAARQVRQEGAMVSVSAADPVPPGVARQLRERRISVGRGPPEEVLAFLDRWRRQAIG
jgi:NAD(P)-dependent dehydrogenase (short-subunit alcohol dehydrogenase family)